MFHALKQSHQLKSTYSEDVSEVIRKIDRQKRKVVATNEKEIDSSASQTIQPAPKTVAVPVNSLSSHVVISDYVGFVSNVTLKLLTEPVQTSMRQVHANHFEQIHFNIEEQVLQQLKKGVGQLTLKMIMLGVQKFLVGSKVAFHNVVYDIDEENMVFHLDESFQKFLLYMFLDRMVLDQNVHLVFESLLPSEEAIDHHANQLYGTSLARTIALYFSVHQYKQAIFSVDCPTSDILKIFRADDNDSLDVFLALVAYYQKVDSSREKVVIGFHEDMSHIDWKEASFELPPASVQQLTQAIATLSHRFDVQAQKQESQKDVSDLYKKFNEQVQLSNDLSKKMDEHFNVYSKAISGISLDSEQMIESQKRIIEDQNAILEVLTDDKNQKILDLVQQMHRVLSELTVDVSEESGEVAHTDVDTFELEKLLERLLAEKLSDFSDVLANNVGRSVNTIMKENGELIEIKKEIIGSRNLLKANQENILAHMKAQEEKLDIVIRSLNVLDGGSLEEEMSKLLRSYVGTLRNELLSRLDALVGKMYKVELDANGNTAVASNQTLSDLYDLVLQQSQKGVMTQSVSDLENVLKELAMIKQSIYDLSKQQTFDEDFVQALASKLNVTLDQSMLKQMNTQMQDYVSKDDFVQLQEYLTQSFDRLADTRSSELLVQDIVQGQVLSALSVVTGEPILLQDDRGLSIAMNIDKLRSEIT